MSNRNAKLPTTAVGKIYAEKKSGGGQSRTNPQGKQARQAAPQPDQKPAQKVEQNFAQQAPQKLAWTPKNPIFVAGELYTTDHLNATGNDAPALHYADPNGKVIKVGDVIDLAPGAHRFAVTSDATTKVLASAAPLVITVNVVGYSISGRLELDGGGGSPSFERLPGIQVNLGGASTALGKLESDGSFRFENLRAGADYEVEVVASTLTFKGMSKIAFKALARDEQCGFAIATGGIQGTVQGFDVASGAAVRIQAKAGGHAWGEASVEPNGAFGVNGLPAGIEYTVEPLDVNKLGLQITPNGKGVVKVGTGLARKDFVLKTCSISGQVFLFENNKWDGAAVKVEGGVQLDRVALGNKGDFSVKVPAGVACTFSPLPPTGFEGAQFQPASLSFAKPDKDILKQNFRAVTANLTVKVAKVHKDHMEALTVLVTQGKKKTSMKLATSGNIAVAEFPRLLVGMECSIAFGGEAAKFYESFPMPKYTPVSGANEFRVDATAKKFKISGTVSKSTGGAFEGVTLELWGGPRSVSVTTKADGAYAFPDLAAGLEYSLYPEYATKTTPRFATVWSPDGEDIEYANALADMVVDFTGEIALDCSNNRMTLDLGGGRFISFSEEQQKNMKGERSNAGRRDNANVSHAVSIGAIRAAINAGYASAKKQDGKFVLEHKNDRGTLRVVFYKNDGTNIGNIVTCYYI